MAQIAGRYQVTDSENFKELLIRGGLPEDKAQQANDAIAVVEVTLEGKKVTFKYDEKLGNRISELVLDGEVEEKWREGNVKSSAKLDGNVIKVQSRSADGASKGNRTYTFSDSGLEVVFTTGEDNFTAKRNFKRL